MREIKFRGMGRDGTMRYGDLITVYESSPIIIEERSSTTLQFDVIPTTVGQYT